jgi:hypothetical protein
MLGKFITVRWWGKRYEVRAQEAAFPERAVACFTGSVKKEKNCWQGLEFGL